MVHLSAALVETKLLNIKLCLLLNESLIQNVNSRCRCSKTANEKVFTKDSGVCGYDADLCR